MAGICLSANFDCDGIVVNVFSKHYLREIPVCRVWEIFRDHFIDNI
jgi:hypothetical protein